MIVDSTACACAGAKSRMSSSLILHPQMPEPPPVIPGTAVTKNQLLTMIMTYVLMHHLTNAAFKHLLEMIDLILPDAVPKTLYLFRKHFNDVDVEWELHFYCGTCLGYIGTRTSAAGADACASCRDPFNFDRAEKEKKFFAYIPLKKQLKNLLKDTEVSRSLIRKSRWVFDDHIGDVFDGDILRDMIQNGELRDDDFVLTWNVDG